tara:strand:+ start:55 stop:492 length:438 start_codon:yes stop_codon:yes gene_type:complete
MTRSAELAKVIGKGSVDIHGEAGTTSSGSTGLTTNLQQGLAKSWINQQNDTIQNNTNDSFNISSAADTATGHSTFTVTNAFSSDTFASVASAGQSSTTDRFAQNVTEADGKQPSSSTFQTKAFDVSTGAANHIDAFMVCCLGDLA